MTFFYDLNKRLAGLASKQLNEGKEKADKDYDGDGKIESPKDEYQGSRIAAAKKAGKMEEGAKPDFLDVDKDGDKKEPFKKAVKDKELDEASYSAKSARAGKDIGKPGKAFSQIAKDAAERYGSKEKGEKVAGAVLKKLRAKEDVNEDEVTEGFKEMDAWLEKRKKEAGTGKFDKKQISTGTVYTRKHEDDDEDEDDDAPVSKGGKEKKKGRKTVGAGKGKKIGAKVKGTSKLHSKGALAEGENTAELVKNASYMLGSLVGRSKRGETIPPKELAIQLDQIFKMISQVMGSLSNPVQEDTIAECSPEEYGMEGDKAKKDLKSVAMAAKELHSILGDNQDLPEWVQDKITRALDYINSSNQYMHQEMGDMEVAEVAPPGAKAERMVKHIKKSLSKDGKLSDKDKAIAYATTWKAHNAGKVEEESTETKDQRAEKAGKKVAKDIEHDEGHKGRDDNKAEKAGKKVTKDIEYDDKKDKVKETDAPKKAKGGIVFGQGVYESMNDKLENMISEGMNINVSMSTNDTGEPTKSITVSAEGEQAEVLAQLLNLAGLHKQEGQVEEAYGDTTPTENKPDYPTDAETTGEDDELLRRWAGGLNKPKSTGQTTIPVIASQTERQVSEETKADRLGMNLYAELKSFKAK